jgi:putative endonuclease
VKWLTERPRVNPALTLAHHRRPREGGDPVEKRFFVYILSSRPLGPLYIGVTSNLVARIYQHKQGEVPGFTRRYNIKQLVYFKIHGCATTAIQREKRMKKWNRDWKVRLIEQENPNWRDLYIEICH